MLDNFAFRRKDRECERFTIHINAEHVPSIFSFSILVQKCDDLPIRCQTVRFAYPPRRDQVAISLHVSIVTQWDSNPLVRVETELNKESGSRCECFAVSRHIELDRDCFQSGSFTLADIAFDVTDCLTVEMGLLFREQVCLLM